MSIELPKWPCLLVQGKKVTKAQAAEIIVATQSSPVIHCNDIGVESKLRDLFEIKQEKGSDSYYHNDEDSVQSAIKSYGMLSLFYLTNNQICSSWIGGPHGWCHWNGNILANNYNIGKWPTVEEVTEDWSKIAEKFPFLTLKSQLLNEEACSDFVEQMKPLVEFVVEKGKVTVNEHPSDMILQPNSISTIEYMQQNLGDLNRELGIDLDKLAKILKKIKKKNAGEN